MTKTRTKFAGLLAASLLTVSTAGLAKAAVLGDDYPTQWKTGYGIDNWTMYYRQCTSFTAFRLSSANGFELPRGYGNASTWGSIARSQGYRVDMTPAVGAVAWWQPGKSGASSYGHVGWVAEVNGNNVTIEEYNYNAGQGPEKYHRRVIDKSQVSGYIHFKDISSASVSPAVTTSTTTASSLKKYRVDDLKCVNGTWLVRCNELAPYDFQWQDNGIPAAVVDEVDSSGNLTADQVLAKGSYIVFNKSQLRNVGTALTGSGGYRWAKVAFANGSSTWLRIDSQSQLLYGK